MSLILSGTNGVSDVDGTAATPALRGSDSNTGIFFPAADTIAFAEGGVESMRLDSAGNLGLGVTPSAWGSPFRAIDINSFASVFGMSSGDSAAGIGRNLFYDGTNWKYKASAAGSLMYQTGSSFQWFQAASGTAGATAPLTQAMTLDASGRLGIGTTSPSFALDVASASVGQGIRFTGNSVQVVMGETGGFGIAGTLSNHSYAFYTSAIERARIDSGGNLLVGATSANARLQVTTPTNHNAIDVRASNASFTSTGVQILIDRNTTNNSFYAITYYNVNAGSYRFIVADSGNVTNTNNSYGAISDIKLKENITDATPKLEKLQQVRVVNYNFVGNEQKQLGVIAQELEPIFPGMVEESPDRDAEGNDLGTTTKSVKYSVFVPMLIKAVQELNAKLEAQAAEIAALKGTA